MNNSLWFSLDTDVGQLISPISPLAIYITIAFLIVIENGLVFGFFFPGDVLLVGAGVVAGSYSDIDIRWVVAIAVAASIVGSQLAALFLISSGASIVNFFRSM